jgi:endonuclease/exonuclease/phosphatase family metal-dependent hydrolase
VRPFRLVTWNMNQQGRDAWSFLVGSLDPDVALVQEAITPKDIDDRYVALFQRAWQTRPWGSAILVHRRVEGAEPLAGSVWMDSSQGAVVVAKFSIRRLGLDPFAIASVHARVMTDPLTSRRRVIPALRKTFFELLKRRGPRFIVAGDLNTARNAEFAFPGNQHGDFWRDVEQEWGFHEPLPFGGKEERQSYWGRWRQSKQPSIGNTLQDDHILLDAETYERVNTRGYPKGCVVWDTQVVRALSDHGPVVVDLLFPDKVG